MSGPEWATAAIVVALWIGAGIPLAWRTVRAMRARRLGRWPGGGHRALPLPPGFVPDMTPPQGPGGVSRANREPLSLFNVETMLARARAGIDPCGWCPTNGPLRPQCAEYVELAERNRA